MPKPSASRPAHRSRHSMANTSARRVQVGSSASGTRPRSRARPGSRAARRASRPASRPVPAIGDLHAVEAGHGVEQHVEPLAGHEPADAEHERHVGVEPVPGPGGAAGRVVAGREPDRVDPRRDDERRRRAVRRRARPASAGYCPAATRPVAWRRTRRRERGRRREPPVHGDLGAVRDDDGRARREAADEMAERQHRVDEHHAGVDLGGRRRRCRGPAPASGAGTAAGCARPGTAAPRPRPGRVGVRGREHGRLRRGQASPQLVEIGLDPADLGREVVRDQQRGRHGSPAELEVEGGAGRRRRARRMILAFIATSTARGAPPRSRGRVASGFGQQRLGRRPPG